MRMNLKPFGSGFSQTFNEDVVGRVLRHEPADLRVLICALAVRLLRSSGAAAVHLLLHSLQTQVEMVPLQESGQLILRELS